MHPWQAQHGRLVTTIMLLYPVMAAMTGHTMAYLVRLSTYLPHVY